jgi:hypothetical protein
MVKPFLRKTIASAAQERRLKMILREPEFTDWLLNAKTPSIRYQTLVDLLGFPATDPLVTQARQAIMTDGPVPAILSQQSESGQWQPEQSYYTPKYVSTHWSMTMLAELSIDGSDVRFQSGVEHMLAATIDELSERLDTGRLGFSCFWGNLLRYALHAGKASDARLEKIIHYAALDLHSGHCRCVHNGGFACAWGVARTLWGLAAIPTAERSPETNSAIAQGVEFLLESFSLIEANYPTRDNSGISPYWFKLNFPLFYQVDILFCLRVLDELNLLEHPGAQPALNWLAQRREADGHWAAISPFRPRTWRALGEREETGRWIDLQASRILLHAKRLRPYNGEG